MNVWRTKDDTWFVLIITPDKLAPVAKAIGRPDLLTDPRFSNPAKLMANMPQLTAILDEIFSAEPMAHWYEVFNGVHVTFGAVRGPQEVINDPQLQANDIIVPLNGAGGKLTSTISSPLQVHGVAKVPAKRAPKIGEHNEEVLRQLGLAQPKSMVCVRAVPFRKQRSMRLSTTTLSGAARSSSEFVRLLRGSPHERTPRESTMPSLRLLLSPVRRPQTIECRCGRNLQKACRVSKAIGCNCNK